MDYREGKGPQEIFREVDGVRLIGIVGYKKSGKTFFITKLAEFLKSKGLKVGILKSIHGEFTDKGTDTGKFVKVADGVGAVTHTGVSLFIKEGVSFDKMLSLIGGDVVLVEGFKERADYPRIILFRTENEIESLSNGLEIAYASLDNYTGKYKPFYPISELDKYLPEIFDIIMKKAFKLPGIDCGSCGFSTCQELGRELLKGNKSLSDCVVLSAKKDVVLKVDGKIVPLLPFVEDLLKNMTLEALSTLKEIDGDVYSITIKKGRD